MAARASKTVIYAALLGNTLIALSKYGLPGSPEAPPC
jgi:hypothetical protein